MRLQQRVLAITLPLIMAPILVLGVISVSYNNSAIKQLELMQLDKVVTQRAAELGVEIERVTSVVMYLAHNKDVIATLRNGQQTPTLLSSLEMFTSVYPEVKHVTLQDGVGKEVITVSTEKIAIKEKLELKDDQVVDWQIVSSRSGALYIQIHQKLSGKDFQGRLKFLIKSDWITTKSINSEEGAVFLISDLNGRVVFSYPAGELGSYIPNRLVRDLLTARENNLGTSIRIGADDIYFVSEKINDNYLFIFGQEHNSLADTTESITWITGIIILIAVLCTTMLVYFTMNRYVISPIQRLSRAKQKVAQGNLDVKLDTHDIQDEFGELFASFNIMVRQLIVYREKERDSRLRLEYKVKERTEELEAINTRLESVNKDIDQARKESEQASAMKTAFVANMSHEIRTPLTAILGFTEQVIASGPHDQHQLDMLGRVLKSGKHLLSLINNVLDMSKIEANKLQMAVEEIELLDLFNDVISLLSIQASDKGLDLQFNYNFPLPKTVCTDETRLRQILVNLASNAIKFTEQGSVGIQVGYNEEKRKVIVDVTDTGIGMTQEVIDSIFNPFTQADTSTSRKFGGTGLGLVISKNLATMLGGDITVKSEIGIGSCFTFEFDAASHDESFEPVIIQSMLELATEESEDKVESLNKKNSSDKFEYTGRVLIAEDVEDNQLLLSLLLNSIKVDHDIVANGEQAVEMAMTHDYGLILMDMQMPIMGGEEATQLLRQSGVDTPIYALTANVMKEDLEKHLRAGCNGTIAKPIDKKSLLKVVRNVLNQYVEEELDPELEKSILKIKERYIGHMPEQITLIEFYLETKNREMLQIELHKIKGTGGNCGLLDLSKLAGELEAVLKKDTVGLNWTSFAKDLNKFLDYMKQLSAPRNSAEEEQELI